MNKPTCFLLTFLLILFQGKAQIHKDFEQWPGLDPQGWMSTNSLAIQAMAPLSVNEWPGYLGTGVRITNEKISEGGAAPGLIWYNPDGSRISDTIAGFMSTYIPIGENPDALKAWYNYQSGNGLDMGGIYAQVTRFEGGQTQVLADLSIVFGSSNGWTLAEGTFDYQGNEAIIGDSLMVAVFVSLEREEISFDSELLFDELFVGSELYLGLEESFVEENRISIEVYPNPCTEKLWIEGLGNKMELSLHQYDGKKVLVKSGLQEKELLDVSGLSPGLYFIQVWEEGKRLLSKPLIIQS